MNNNSNKIVFYGRIKKEIIECDYQKKASACDIVLNMDIDSQTISFTELGNLREFRCTRRPFDKGTKFMVLENIDNNKINYLQLHFKNNTVYSIELTNSKDSGYIYFDESILNR